MKWDCEPDEPEEPTEKPEAEEGHKQAADSQEAPEEPFNLWPKTRRVAHGRPYPARTDAEDQRLHKLTRHPVETFHQAYHQALPTSTIESYHRLHRAS